jgi:pimeloyl-ACP methyl ester carboxylesterase
MQLPDRATDVLAELVSQQLDKEPIVFVCHSLGGLLVKQTLRIAADQRRTRGAEIFKQTRGVVFLGTPNMGSHLANWTDRFRVLARPSDATAGLAANDAYLRDLNIWYRDHCGEAGFATMVFFETKSTNGVMVVEAMSADPGLPGIRPIPVDSDHIGICKPTSRDTTFYRTIRRFVDESFHDSKLLTPK